MIKTIYKATVTPINEVRISNSFENYSDVIIITPYSSNNKVNIKALSDSDEVNVQLNREDLKELTEVLLRLVDEMSDII
jgi:hypothetical protein